MTKEENTGKKVAIGAFIAGVAGYITGILTAPRSGKETREDIADRALDIKDNAEEQLQNAHNELNQLINDTKNKSLALKSKARQEYNEAVIKARDAQNKAAALLKAVKSGEASDPELEKAIRQVKQAQKNLIRFLKS